MSVAMSDKKRYTNDRSLTIAKAEACLCEKLQRGSLAITDLVHNDECAVRGSFIVQYGTMYSHRPHSEQCNPLTEWQK